MTSYAGQHAELYDLFYADKPYQAEADFVHECFQKYGLRPVSRVLELACGTGSHALFLDKLGYLVLATDHSEDMLAVARRKAQQLGSRIEFRLQDMTKLELPGDPFDAAVCLFDSIGYVVTNERLKQVLTGVWRQLKPDALFVFEFWHAAPMISQYDPLRVRSWDTAEGKVVRISETTLNISQQTSDVTYSVYEFSKDGTYSSFQETQTNRYFLVQEMEYLLSSCGFQLVKSFSGFRNDQVITRDTWHVVAVARRGER